MKLGASSLRLGHLTGADGVAHSAGDSWWPAHLSLAECSSPDQCGRVRAVTGPCWRLVWDDGAVCSQDRTRTWAKTWELIFDGGNCQGSSWAVMGRLWEVIGERVQEDKWHHFGQSLATDRPGSYLTPLSINISLWGQFCT